MSDLERAVELLRQGRLVAIPTETVYGLAADAGNEEAVRRIYTVKGRPLDHPVIVHLGSPQWICRWAREVPPTALELVSRFWPGPLTLILPRAPGVGNWITGGQDTVGLRMPDHPLTLDLLKRFGGGLAAPSANRFGHISPTTAQHVREDLGAEVDLVLDGGACRVGLESTIVDLSGPRPRLLRPGQLTLADLSAVVGPFEGGGPQAPRAPGTLETHYAPHKPARALQPNEVVDGLAVLTFGQLALNGHPLAWEVLADNPEAAAQQLYAALRRLDASAAPAIVVQAPPSGPGWDGIRDRLRRALRG